MVGWNRGKYERLMGKIFKDRPTQLCTFNVIKSKIGIGNPQVVVSVSFDVPCIIDIETVKDSTATSITTIVRNVSYMVEKKHLEGRVFSDGTPVEIQKLMTHTSLSGYWGVQIIPVQSTVIDEEGMIPVSIVSGGKVAYADFSDGCYRNFIDFSTFDKSVAI